MRVFIFNSVTGKLSRVYEHVRRIVRRGDFVEFWAGYRTFLGSCPITTPWQAIYPNCGFCLYAGTPNEGLCYCCDYGKKVDCSNS